MLNFMAQREESHWQRGQQPPLLPSGSWTVNASEQVYGPFHLRVTLE